MIDAPQLCLCLKQKYVEYGHMIATPTVIHTCIYTTLSCKKTTHTSSFHYNLLLKFPYKYTRSHPSYKLNIPFWLTHLYMGVSTSNAPSSSHTPTFLQIDNGVSDQSCLAKNMQ